MVTLPVKTEATERAHQLDGRLSTATSELAMPPPNELFLRTRAYLQQLADGYGKRNNVYDLIKKRSNGLEAVY